MPVMPIAFVVVVVIAAVVLLVFQRMRLQQGIAQNQDKDFGAIAARLGLRVEVGDPSTNILYFMEQMGNYERELRASGQPYAHPVAFRLVDSVKSQDFVAVRRVTRTYGCFLQLKLRKQIPPFEVVLRSPNQFLIPTRDLAERTELRDALSGDTSVDAKFVIRAADPLLAPLLAPALAVLAQQLFVHLAGEGDELWINVTRMGLPYFSAAPEEYLLAIETAACSIEGLALPARLGVPAMPPTVALGQ
jgi:hypothetical protein